MMLPAVVLAVGLLGGGFLMKPAPAPAAAAVPVEEETEVEAPGPVVETEPITINLADGHYLKLALALELAAPEEGGEEEEAPPEGFHARAVDAAIATFSLRTVEELSDPATRDEVKAELIAHVAEAYHDEVAALYFTEFVTQ